MKIYHGTSAKFDDFDLSRSRNQFYGQGAYFTDSKDDAEMYAKNAMRRSDVDKSAGPRIVEKNINQAALLNLRSLEITDETVRLAARRLGKKLDEKTVKEITDAHPNERIVKFRARLGLDAPALLAQKCGKVGFIATSVNADEGDIFVINSAKYLNDAKYAQNVNRHGATPEFVRKMDKKLGEIQHLDKMSDDLAAKSKVFTKRDKLTKSYIKAITRLSEKLPINVNRMKKSLKKIDEGNDAGWTPERSVRQGVRFALIDEAREKTHGKLCRILGTTADEPDLEHSLLEGEIMACEEVLEHLSRFGCQHNYEIID